MGSEKLDPLHFETWEDAFQHPVTTVRRLEQQLRSHADENREKLRTLVGLSYRDLLGTAERIIMMDTQVHEVEMTLGRAGQKSNARAVTQISTTFGTLQSESKSRLHARNSLASQMATLGRCPVIISRILKRQGSLLLAAKLIVLARLIHKALSQQSDVPELVEVLRNRLASLRRKLLHAIDKRFSEPERDEGKLVDDMCAFSLLTSSTPSDVLRHFHHIRLEAIRWHLDQDSDVEKHALDALHLMLGTLHQSQHIFPKRLSEVLVCLKDQPLIQQFDIRAVSELDLGIHARWLTEEVRNYTPWPRHDELSKPEAEKLLKIWARSAQKVFVSSLTNALSHVSDFGDLLHIRRVLFEAWPWTDKRLPGLHSADVVDQLREMFNTKLAGIIEAQVAKLMLVCRASQAVTEQLGDHEVEPSLWRSSLTNFDVAGGAEGFKDAILASYNGTNEAASDVVRHYDDAIESIQTIRSNLKQMRETQWDDDLDADEDNLDSRQVLLSVDDPRTLNESLAKSVESVAGTLSAEFSNFTKTISSVDSPASKSVFTIRVLRRIIQQTNLQDQILVSAILPVVTASNLISPLHARVATAVIMSVEPLLKRSLARISMAHTVVGRNLWEGSPQLPVQPSAMTFRILRLLIDRMAALGSDLWSESAASTLKMGVRKTLSSHTINLLSGLSVNGKIENANGRGDHETPTYETKGGVDDEGSVVGSKVEHVNGDVEKEPVLTETKDSTNGETSAVAKNDEDEEAGRDRITNHDVIRKEKLTQLALDLNYLDAALASREITMKEAIGKVEAAAGLQESETSRLRKHATDYWKRTYLLFAFLS